jgi:hypothetical protein
MSISLVAVALAFLVAGCIAGKPDLPNVAWRE